MSKVVYDIVKGTRIRAWWFAAKPVGLTGVQLKIGADRQEIVGVVRHVRGNHPTSPTRYWLYVETEDGKGDMCARCGVSELEVDPKHVVEILLAE